MEELVTKHSKIMDKYDPDKRIALAVDEWGCWFHVEPGTNPGFLYQQNTMRDALVAGLTLNIFNKHSDRVRIANIAQLVNVLQSVILTEGEKMLLTPTYHVFHMYKCHQEATLIDSYIDTKEIGEGEARVVNLQESASIGVDGKLNITMNNLSVTESYEVSSILTDFIVKSVKAEILNGDMSDHNTFESPDKVRTKEFTNFTITEKGIDFNIPPCSVLHLEIEV